MVVVEEVLNAIQRQTEIVEYERTINSNIRDCEDRLKAWFKNSKNILVGRGGRHVFVYRKDIKRRVLLITE